MAGKPAGEARAAVSAALGAAAGGTWGSLDLQRFVAELRLQADHGIYTRLVHQPVLPIKAPAPC